ncbi:hypothetical protein P154DRAFT_599249 [Amniculicola lignicola CBS 123094]|uniref:Altered inheritance of mitochondria protein 11 n=1 Tax=Amniculicola lignicola CBS 123094 TaxID=1392246 RepID=A0A6A5WH43_9PLEO|nr:hypothetical protein P154DRAFT_599249 [Amniculicola lignicola CBS 123094]
MARAPAAASSTPPRPSHETAYETTPITSPRSLRQLSIFVLGATCFLASTALTRRAIYRRQLRSIPKFYDANTNPHEHFSPMHDAMQALNLATLNCLSVGTMMVGGALWSFDISGLKEMRAGLRGHLGYHKFETEDLRQNGFDDPENVGGPLETSIVRKRQQAEEKRSPETPR